MDKVHSLLMGHFSTCYQVMEGCFRSFTIKLHKQIDEMLTDEDFIVNLKGESLKYTLV